VIRRIVIVSDPHMAAPGGPVPVPLAEDDAFAAAAVALYTGTLAAQLARTSFGLSLGDGPPPTAHPRRAAEPLDGSPRPKAVPV
jgi:hypothetical protein